MADDAPRATRQSARLASQTPGARQQTRPSEGSRPVPNSRTSREQSFTLPNNDAGSSADRPRTPVNDDDDDEEPITPDELRGNGSPMPRRHNRTPTVLASETLLQPERATIVGERTFVGGIIGKKPPEFEGKKRDHMVAHDWIRKHRRFHMLNPQITPEYRTLNSVQYLSNTAATWHQSIGEKFNSPGDNFDQFVRLFLARWDEFNWRDKALAIFNQTKQEGANSDIEVYNMTFQMAYQAVTEEVTPYVAIRVFIDGLKPKTRASLEQSFALLQSLGHELDINEVMASAVRFESIHKITHRPFMSSGSRGNGSHPPSNNNGHTNPPAEQNLNTMQGTRDISHIQCFNCQQYGHYQVDCQNASVARNPNQQGRGGRGRGRGRGRGGRGQHSGNA